jgi:hypothetical protein
MTSLINLTLANRIVTVGIQNIHLLLDRIGMEMPLFGGRSSFSGFVACAKLLLECLLQKKYADMTDRMYNSINRFITTDNNLKAYAVYPQNGNERYYDDNVWIGLDMAELYEQTKEKRFLEEGRNGLGLFDGRKYQFVWWGHSVERETVYSNNILVLLHRQRVGM